MQTMLQNALFECIIPSIPLREPPKSISKRCARLEAEVLLERCGVGICDRDVAWLHRDEFLVGLEIVVGRQYAGTDQFLLKNRHEVQKILRGVVADVIYLVRRNRKAVLAGLLLRGMSHDTHNSLHDVIDIGEVAFTVAVVEDLDGLPFHELVRETEICHIRTSCRAVNSEEPQSCGRYVVEFRIGVRHQFVALFRRGIEAYRIVHLVVSGVRHFLVRTINT